MHRSLPILLVTLALAGCGAGNAANGERPTQLLNVSYDPTRELWRDLNTAFGDEHARLHGGEQVRVKQSHGASGSQARAVIDGLDADVVSLALWSDTDQLRRQKLLVDDWLDRLPNRSLPYTSTIVFVVRKGNPKAIRDWPDLAQPGLEIITPNPKTSGNGKLAFLAAWGSVLERGGSEQQAREFVTKLYRQVPVLDTGARGATTTFAQKGIGDVHLTWENEAHLEVAEAGGALEIVYPPVSILAEPHVAIVDANVDRHGTRALAEEYLRFAYTPAAQEIIARHHYRPIDEVVLARHRQHFPEMTLFNVTRVAANWDDVQSTFFADGGVFDSLYQRK